MSSRRQFLRQSLGAVGTSLVAPRVAAPAASADVPAPSRRKLSSFDPQVKRLLSELTLEQKVGQMTQPDQSFLQSPDDIQKFHLGSVLQGGDSDPKSGNDLASWADLCDQLTSRGAETKPRIPLLFGVDAVHGHNNVLGATIFPHEIGLGCTRSAELVEKTARVTAQEVRTTGANWNFAPCVAVPRDIRWGRTYEGYSESPELVKGLGAAAVRGLQGESLDDPLSVAACAKHFAGDGGTVFGTGMTDSGNQQKYPLDHGDTRLDDAVFRKIHLQGYLTTIAEGVATIMPSFSSWNGVKCSANRVLLTEILKEELGFEGFLISDYAAHKELPGTYKQQIETTINAGMDMVMVPDNYPEFIHLLTELVSEGRVATSRIDDAVTRILRVKFAIGLMERGRSPLADRSLLKTFGAPEHRAVARQCVRESLVLLKNERALLPIHKGMRVYVAGKCADDIGNQCGGWTVKWQGASGAIMPGGTTILAALRKALGETNVTFSRDGSGAAGATMGVAVIGETPYAEMFGDRSDLSLAAEDVAVVDELKRAGIPVVVVLVSGRPLALESIMDKADAVVAAWLPGSEGDGVADVLTGAWKPTGKLSFTWPKGTSTSFHLGDRGYETLFPFGFGLTY